jgi:spermidine/putrescine transport system permease protein
MIQHNRSFRHINQFCAAITGFGLFLLYFPFLYLIAGSFWTTPLDAGALWGKEFSLHWYQTLFSHPESMRALFNSIQIAAMNTVLSTTLGTLTAIGLHHFPRKWKLIIKAMTSIPLLMPEIVLGISLLIWFCLLHISLGLWSLTLAHVTFSISYVILMVLAGLETLDPVLIEAARGLGAGSPVIFREIILPHIKPQILSGAVIACTLSFDDFLISYFTSGVDCETLPVHIYSTIKLGLSPEINALSTILVTGTAGLVVLFSFLKK